MTNPEELQGFPLSRPDSDQDLSKFIRNIAVAFGTPSGEGVPEHTERQSIPEDGTVYTRAEAVAAYFAQEAQDGPPNTPFYDVDGEGVTRPRDPVTNRILRLGEIPPSILLDPGMRRGFQFLAEHGHATRIKVLLTNHKGIGDVARAGIDLPGEARRLAGAGGALYIEGAGMQQADQDSQSAYDIMANAAPDTVERHKKALLDIAEQDEREAWGAGVMIALLATGVKVRNPDVITDSPRIPDMAATALMEYMDTIDPSDGIAAQVEYVRVSVAFDYYRDMCIVGRIGEDMADEFEATGSVTDRALLVGSLHENVGYIFGQHNADVTVAGSRLTDPMSQIHIQCVRNGAVTVEDFAALVAAEEAIE